VNNHKDDVKLIGLAFDDIEKNTPSLKPVVTAFRELFVSRAIMKAAITDIPGLYIPEPDKKKLSQGYPWLTEQNVASLVDPWGNNIISVSNSIADAFPKIKPDMLNLVNSIENGDTEWGEYVVSFIEGDEDNLGLLADQIRIQSSLLKFILFNLIKPFVEKRVENLKESIKEIPWFEGYCPICGAFPELSILQGKEGQRWLKCSFCGYDWRYDRMTCPFCGEKDEHKEVLSIDGNDHKWVELCSLCNRYISNIDLRENKNMRADIAAIGMIHLDAIAQKKGFIPTADCSWKVITPLS
jgi:FdhE protein